MNFEIKIQDNFFLKLRNVDDAESFFALTDKNREHLQHWFPWVEMTKTIEDTKLFIEKCEKGFRAGVSADFGIWYEHAWIGSMGFHKIDKENSWAEIGYWIDKENEGKGLMTLCVEEMIRYGFDELHLHRLQIKCDSSNKKSKAIPDRLGFVCECILRENHKRDEAYTDELIYGLLDREYKKY
jgi:ribosomal-protein-serine acetyltransferase